MNVECNLRILEGGPLNRNEVMSSQIMKDLTGTFGFRGKSAKQMVQEAFERQVPGERSKIDNPVTPTCEEQEVRPTYTPEPDGQLMERPAAMVSQSAYIRHLETIVRLELARTGCAPPSHQPCILDGDGDVTAKDTEEKKLIRLKIYKRAFGAVILHFEALRPLLRDIKASYDQVLGLRDRQLQEIGFLRKGISESERALDDRAANVRFEGFKQLSGLEKQCFLLNRHIDKQDQTIRTMTSILAKVENSLSEEHELRVDSEDQRKLLISEINEHRKRIGLSPKPMTMDRGVSARNTGLNTPEVFEFEPEIITSSDPIVLRKALEMTRKNLTEAHQKIDVMEVEKTEVVTKEEHETLLREFIEYREKSEQILREYEEKVVVLVREVERSQTAASSAFTDVSSGQPTSARSAATSRKSRSRSKKKKKKRGRRKKKKSRSRSKKKKKGSKKKRSKKSKKKKKRSKSGSKSKTKKKRTKKTSKGSKSQVAEVQSSGVPESEHLKEESLEDQIKPSLSEVEEHTI